MALIEEIAQRRALLTLLRAALERRTFSQNPIAVRDASDVVGAFP
jgi:hypothetical protein